MPAPSATDSPTGRPGWRSAPRRSRRRPVWCCCCRGRRGVARAEPRRARRAHRPQRVHDRAAQLHRQPLLDLPAAVRRAAAADGRRTVARRCCCAARAELRRAARRGGLAFALALSVLLISAAWPSIGAQLLRDRAGARLPRRRPARGGAPALAPAADRSARARGQRAAGPLRSRVARAIVVLPTAPDLGVEILMRARRANPLFIGDPVDDSLVPSRVDARARRRRWRSSGPGNGC